MDKRLIYRIALVVGVLVISSIMFVPSVMYDYDENVTTLPEWWQKTEFLPHNNLVLGLDLQGGMDILVSVNAQEAVVNELRHIEEVMKREFEQDDIPFTRLEVNAKEELLYTAYPTAEAEKNANKRFRKYYQSDLVVVEGENTLHPTYTLRDAVKKQILKRSVNQVKEILARRMDAYGLREPEIVVQGDNSIRLQLPGVKDPATIKELIRRTAKLDFMLVDSVGLEKAQAEAEANGPPAGYKLATWTDPNDPDKKVECYFPDSTNVAAGPVPPLRKLVLADPKSSDEKEKKACYLLKEDQMVSGKDLKDARVGYDTRSMSNYAVVNFEWNLQGARRFSELTGDHIGDFLAIVLEGHVVSAPRINDKIFARGQISGRFTSEEATILSNVLRSGALDVGIKIEEERTVGPSLGADSIQKGKTAIFWGFVVVVIFMVVYYMGAGIIADVALFMNLFLIMALLSMFGATLTLPGIAGIVLTVGMAVDANVLIFERIREELRTGKTPAASIDAGYGKALWTILDANITTLIAALVLLQWGTGPIKGFAVTLSLGVISSMFTAIIVTRVIYDIIGTYRKATKLSIGIKYEPAAKVGKGR